MSKQTGNGSLQMSCSLGSSFLVGAKYILVGSALHGFQPVLNVKERDMAEELTGKVGIVAGGSRGIGRAVALRLGKSGAIVALT